MIHHPFHAMLLVGAFALTFGIAGAATSSRPNVILIFSDDHGYADLGAQGIDRDIRTPHLDALARDGVRFTKGYVTAPQCVPSRAGVITGRYQQRFGVEENGKGPLPLAELTIAERLKPVGYVSAHVGKWHLEPPPPRVGGPTPTPGQELAFFPLAQGFDEYATGAMNSFVASHDLQSKRLPDAPQRLNDPRFRCDWQTDAAIAFIERHARDPFFVYLAYYTPHVPLDSPEPWFSRTPPQLPKERRQALAMIAAMDDGIGRLRATLRQRGLEQNTLIFFIGDNGAPLRDTAWNGSLNTPHVGEKGMLTDGGIRVPFLAAWPSRLPEGRVYDLPVSSLDVAATALAAAGLPADRSLDGVDLLPYLTGAKSDAPHETLYWRWRSQAAILEGKWKLVLLGSKGFLFDASVDGSETRNLLDQNSAVADRLYAKLQSWADTLQPPGLPTEIERADALFFAAHIDKNLTPTFEGSAARPAAKRKKQK